LLPNQELDLTNDGQDIVSNWLKYVYFKGNVPPEFEQKVKQFTPERGSKRNETRYETTKRAGYYIIEELRSGVGRVHRDF
jgi:hypothetical protein